MTGADATSLIPRYQAYGLSAFAAVLHFLGWAGFGAWPLGLVCLVPFWIALEGGLQRSWRHTLAVGWVYGAVSYSGGYHWLVEFLEVFSGYGFVASTFFFLAFCVYLGFDYALYGMAYRVLRKRGWPTVVVAIPVLLLAFGIQLGRMRLSRPCGADWAPVMIRLFLGPLVAVALALLLGLLGVFGALDAKVFILMSALPPAVYNYLLAERLGGDVASASRIILGSTLLSFGSIPVMLWLLG